MPKPQKLVEKWKQNRPRLVRINEIKSVLAAYFPDQWKWEGGSHIVVRSDILKKYRAYQPYGEISLATVSGKEVKWYYTKDLLTAIEVVLREMEADNE